MRTETSAAALCAALVFAAARAHAGPSGDGLEAPGELASPPVAAPQADAPERSHGDARKSDPRETLDRAFAYVPDPRLPPSLSVIGSYAASYSSTDAASRPLAALSGRSGLVSDLGAELGLFSRMSVAGSLSLAPARGAESSARAAGRAQLRGLVTDPESKTFRLTLGAGYLREFSPASGPFAEVAATLDVGRARFGALCHAEKMLADDRDSVDLYAAAGASVLVLAPLRVGAEYVGQEFEDAWEEEEAEGGVRHFAGLTLAVAPTERISIVGGPALGMSQAAPRWLGRIAAAYRF